MLNAAREELRRSKEHLKMPGEEGPYFIRYLIRDYDETEISSRYGALADDSRDQARHAAVEVRVGSYKFDNTADDATGKLFDFDDVERWDPPHQSSLDNNIEALRGTLWLLTDAQYKQALSTLHKKRGARVTKMVEDESITSFSHEKPVRAVDPPLSVSLDREAWKARTRRLSGLFQGFPEIFESQVKLTVSHQVRTLLTSEGTELINERLIYGVHLSATGRATDGLLIEHAKSYYGGHESELPSEADLVKAVDEMGRQLRALRAASMMDPYNGPAILLPEAAGVFFHEALGHRLEGERQNSTNEGATFKGQIGQPVLPTFISVYDDPTLEMLDHVSLNGHYGYDDEGVSARPVTLVDHGVLRSYLMSRTPVKGAVHSNGHGRSEGIGDPMGRMASTIVKSDLRVPYAKLKEMLLAEIARQKKTFGLIIADISGGQTNTTTYDFQAFKGMPRIVYKVDGKTGAETLVRGVEFVGTPIGSLNRIVAASDQTGAFNGYCGAESGFVPVSTVAPAVLISEIELQRTRRALERPPILAAPWAGKVAPPPVTGPLPGAKPAPARTSTPKTGPTRTGPSSTGDPASSGAP